MKSKLWMVFTVVAVIVFAIVFWQRPSQHQPVLQAIEKTSQPANVSAIAPGVSHLNDSNVTPQMTSSANPTPPGRNRMTIKEVLERMVEDKNKPVNFYGQVIDQ